jgi:MFS family permease
VSLLAVVVVLAFFAGIAYAFVAIPAQTQLQEELPEDVRGRVFGVLNMLVSVASFLPILIVGPIADLLGTTVVIVAVGLVIVTLGIGSVLARGPIRPEEATRSLATADHRTSAVDPAAVVAGTERHVAEAEGRRGGPGVALQPVPSPILLGTADPGPGDAAPAGGSDAPGI